MLAHDAALLGIPVDTARLYDRADGYDLWIEAVITRVRTTYDAARSSGGHR